LGCIVICCREEKVVDYSWLNWWWGELKIADWTFEPTLGFSGMVRAVGVSALGALHWMSHTTLVNLSLGAASGGDVTAEPNAIARWFSFSRM
jgi:hypothetical protein